MDMPSYWLQESETQEQGFLNHYQMNKSYYCPTDDLRVDSFSSDSYIETPSLVDQFNKKLPPTEKPKPKPKPKLVSDAPNSFTISFGDIKPKDEFLSYSDSSGFTAAGKKRVPTTVKNPAQVQEHVLAERKRREKLAQRFISLSSLLPDQKKMDKATVLEDAANYIQELENRVKKLERKNMQESAIAYKKSRISSSDNGSSSNEANLKDQSSSLCNPEIEVRTSGCNLLVEIYSRKNGMSLVKVLSEMQKFGLSIISCRTMPFADTTLLVTIVAQNNNDVAVKSADLVKNLLLVV
ncbi:transcription factor bHLH18-like [Bidens hawaiensis]|uniref:transcription factor bHLH18-like n=1 Tax=Bidens hawaiensis TaxID=980011 RepID=UPI004049967C